MGLNPLESGQCFGPNWIVRHDNGYRLVSIPSNRVNVSDLKSVGADWIVRHGLNPLESGQCFGHMENEIKGEFDRKSQSPRIGSMFRTQGKVRFLRIR